MSILAPETEARQALITVLQNEFAIENFPVKSDYVHESLGHKGTVLGVSPMRSTPTSSNNLVNEMYLMVQFYGKYDLRVDPTQTVDPTVIETYAERFRRAVRLGDPNSATVWYFQVTNVNFPQDPTGNKTRFEATVVARGNNSALLESVA